jgi:hypothetical protein
MKELRPARNRVTGSVGGSVRRELQEMSQNQLSVATGIPQATSRADVVGVALVGSCARGMVAPDSDIDLVVLSELPALPLDESRLSSASRRARGCRSASWPAAEQGVGTQTSTSQEAHV